MKMNSRKNYLDILKIFACFCVLADHSNYFVSTGGARINPGTAQYPIAFIYLTIAHVAVTLFVMISGALLLGKEESYKKCFVRVIKTSLVIVIFTLIHYLFDKGLNNFDVKEYCSHVIKGDYIINYWYLYMYLGLLVMLPILRKMVQVLKEMDFLCIMLLTFICSFDFITGLNPWFNLPIFTPFLGVFILGYYLDNYDIKELIPRFLAKEKVLFIVSSIGLVIDILFVALYSARESRLDNTVSNRLFCWNNIFFIYMAIYLFYWAKKLWSEKTDSSMRSIGLLKVLRGTYGIYLVHGTFMMVTAPYITAFLDNSPMPQMINWLVLDIGLFVVCLGLTMVVKLVPGMKRLI